MERVRSGVYPLRCGDRRKVMTLSTLMPMNVAPIPAGEWQTTLQAAWDKLSELERVARDYEGDGGRYIRPILLVQVERTGAEQADAGYIHANDARDWLKAVAGLDDDHLDGSGQEGPRGAPGDLDGQAQGAGLSGDG